MVVAVCRCAPIDDSFLPWSIATRPRSLRWLFQSAVEHLQIDGNSLCLSLRGLKFRQMWPHPRRPEILLNSCRRAARALVLMFRG